MNAMKNMPARHSGQNMIGSNVAGSKFDSVQCSLYHSIPEREIFFLEIFSSDIVITDNNNSSSDVQGSAAMLTYTGISTCIPTQQTF